MSSQVIRTGGTVRVVVSPRSILSVEIVDGYLIVTYTDGTTQNVGYIGIGPISRSVFGNGAWNDMGVWSDLDVWKDVA